MKKTRYTEDQIIGILKESDAGIGPGELCWKHGISQGTLYRWKAKFGGMDVNEARRLRHLEDENGKLKRLVADLSLDRKSVV